jgi:heme A synthase
MARNQAGHGDVQFDRIAATIAGLVIIGLAVFLLVRNEPVADPRLFFVLRLVVSFAAAILGAAIPGFLDLSWKGGGMVVRAGGALALFVLTFVYTPDLVTGQDRGGQTTISAPGGVAAGRIDRSPITVNSQPTAPATRP